MRLPFAYAFVCALLLLLASKAQADQPLYTEYRALAFMYIKGKYERVTDMFDHGWKTQQECVAAASAGMRAIAPSLTNGGGIVAACVVVPVLPTT